MLKVKWRRVIALATLILIISTHHTLDLISQHVFLLPRNHFLRKNKEYKFSFVRLVDIAVPCTIWKICCSNCILLSFLHNKSLNCHPNPSSNLREEDNRCEFCSNDTKGFVFENKYQCFCYIEGSNFQDIEVVTRLAKLNQCILSSSRRRHFKCFNLIKILINLPGQQK